MALAYIVARAIKQAMDQVVASLKEIAEGDGHAVHRPVPVHQKIRLFSRICGL